MGAIIPKKIHYCWFGGNPKSKIIEACIESWKKFLPDYEIIEWNESNFDIHICKYVEEAYERKKWAFVSDYCRIWALYQHGGVYFDTDVEIIKDPEGIFENACVGFETKTHINPGLVVSCPANDWLCRLMLDEYNADSFILENGKNNYRTICDRMTDFLVEKGLRLDNTFQSVGGYNIYPTEYFNPYNSKKDKFEITEKTITLHRFLASWQNEDSCVIKKDTNLNGVIFVILVKILGYERSKRFVAFVKRVLFRGGKDAK